METTNLNYLFIDLISNYSHLITVKRQTKNEFLEAIKKTYCLTNPKNKLFFIAVQKSIFNTVKIDRVKNTILFNQ